MPFALDDRTRVTPAVLLLFDIDGTLLLGAHHEHRDALHAALSKVFGLADPAAAHVEAPGRTDGEIARNILLLSGYSAERIDRGARALRAVACREYARRAPEDLRGRVAPGMPELLDRLAATDGVRLALLTGNFEPIARLKLERAGLGHHFEAGQGAFGSDGEDRAGLPALARRRAAVDGHPFPRERTVVIGDTPNDIACARADGVRCVAVASGPFGPDRLSAADAVARDARELGALLGSGSPISR
jgi:phosphoglycolate phosphatase-like HAD superfamily hydrolase